MKTKQKQNSHYVSSPANGYYHSLRDLILTTRLAGYTRIYADDSKSSAKTWWTRKVQGLCCLCHRVTESLRLHRLRSRLGIWAEILATNLLVARIRGSLAMGFSRKVRQLLRESTYKTAFQTRLDPDSQSAEAWLTTNGGGYVAAGVGGGITGKGAHILLIDDPVKNREDAESQNNRDGSWDWYTSTAYTRLAPGGGVLVILTRWHDDDLAGRLLKASTDGGDEWEVIRYPAIAEEDEEFREQGDALHPERYDVESLQRIQRAVGPRDWSALYQQNPVADDGDYFTRDMIRYYDPEEVDLDAMRYYAAWDLAIGKRDRNDYSVGMVIGVNEYDQLFVMDVVRGRFDGFELVEQILDLYETWHPSIIGIEKGHIEMALGPFLEKRVRERGLVRSLFQRPQDGAAG